ncbi:uncharacterized protein LOC107009763 [Solanum pennellii]|uniref:Uncharacterized protein LOC107009763 n=1 Tax=Solanum pennellii TaxID=28526 RepID=A0ABM1G1G9_SOLPN|nr:uncharacterized protein LOC107009763 [Solanum pennellii]
MAPFEALYGRRSRYLNGLQSADNRKQPLVFDVRDQVYLNLSPMKGVMRFCIKKKLSLRYVGTYEILQCGGLGVDGDLSYEEVPIEILDWQVKRLRNKEDATVKVLWKNHLVVGATWEDETEMRSRYAHLFIS